MDSTFKPKFLKNIFFYIFSSYSYKDELLMGAAWLHKATGESFYLRKAQGQLDNVYIYWTVKHGLTRDSKTMGIQAVLYDVTKDSRLKRVLEVLILYAIFNAVLANTPCNFRRMRPNTTSTVPRKRPKDYFSFPSGAAFPGLLTQRWLCSRYT